ncbi:hypothetical protein H6790_00370 [Candidatus Nomurabacteria bacterium]|nr:hypothetical protein [Candidatus Nomurabacteria bacterium]MCB9820390.1 hypothetical protein [Candidatus Nomurabacteria bacterium]
MLNKIKLVALILFVAFAFTGKAFADSGDNVSGLAWSKNIGYISFNCTDNDACLTADTEDGGVGEDITFGPTYQDYRELAAYYENPKNISFVDKVAKFNLFKIASNVFSTKKAVAVDIPYDGSNYGVNVDPLTGNMSGYAWSSEVGWISFNEGGCPEGTCTPKVDLASGDITGWARVLAHGDDWDGWISLSCDNSGIFGCSGIFGGSSYGVSVPDLYGAGQFSGYAWGDEVVGWTKFSGPTYSVVVDMDQPQVNLTSSSASTCTEPVTLSWSTQDMASCSLSSSDAIITGESVTIPSGSTTVTPSANPTTYTLNCTGADGNPYSSSVTVALECNAGTRLVLQATPSPVFSTGGYKTTLTWFTPSGTNYLSCTGTTIPPSTPPSGFDGPRAAINATTPSASLPNVYVGTNPTIFRIQCTQAVGGAVDTAETVVARGTLTPSCNITSATLEDGQVDIAWTSTNATSATASWGGAVAVNGSANNLAFTAPETVYTVNVTSTDGTSSSCSAAINAPVVVDGECVDSNPNDPNGEECDAEATLTLTASPTTLAYPGGTVNLSWTTSNTTGGEALSLPSSSFGPVDCEDGDGSENVSVTASTTFTLRCTPLYGGSDIAAYAYVGVGEEPCDPETEECPVLCTAESTSPECRGVPPIIIER